MVNCLRCRPSEGVFGALGEPRRVLAGRRRPRAAIACAAVPRDLPMLNFWSVVLYDDDTRGMTANPQGKAEVNSRQKIVKNDDGSVRLVFSPKIERAALGPICLGHREPRRCAQRAGSRIAAFCQLGRGDGTRSDAGMA
jgi:hypothetical protein